MWGCKFCLALLAIVSCNGTVASDVQLQVEVVGEANARHGVCPGDRVTFTCTTTNTETLTWYVNRSHSLTYSVGDNTLVGEVLPRENSDINLPDGFTVNLTSIVREKGQLISTLTAEVSLDIDQNKFNNTLICCSEANYSTKNMTLLIASPPRLEGEVNTSLTEDCRAAVVELKWTPPPDFALHYVEHYTLTVSSMGNRVPPLLLNGTTSHYTLHLNFSSSYQFGLKAANCVGELWHRPNITLRGYCHLPSPPSRGYIVDQDRVCINEEAEISYSCNQNLIPEGTRKSKCQNGQWVPMDPLNFYCYADCGMPTPPKNGTVDTPSSTIEGSQVFFQCDTRFIPHARNRSECNTEGQWVPDPSDHQCEYICELPEISTTDPPPVCVQGACTDCIREPAGAVAGSSIASLIVGFLAGAAIAVGITTRRQGKGLPARKLSLDQVDSPRPNTSPQERPLPQVPVRHPGGRAPESEYEYMSSAIYSKVELEHAQQRVPPPQNIPEYTPIVP